MKIDFVSDVSCPWCAVGLKSLETALARLGPQLSADLHFQPFELNPQMGPGGQDIVEHLAEKYGSTPEQVDRNQEMIRARGIQPCLRSNLRQRLVIGWIAPFREIRRE